MGTSSIRYEARYPGSAEDLRNLLAQLEGVQGLKITDRDVRDGDIAVEIEIANLPQLEALQRVHKGMAPGIDVRADWVSFDPVEGNRRSLLPRNYFDVPVMDVEGRDVTLPDDFKITFVDKNKVEIWLDGRKLVDAEVKNGKLYLTETDRKEGGGTETSKVTFDQNTDGSFAIKLPNALIVLKSDGSGGQVIAGDQVAKVDSGKGWKLNVSEGGLEARRKLFEDIDNWIQLNGTREPGSNDVALHMRTIDVASGTYLYKGLGKAADTRVEDGYLPNWGSPEWRVLLLDAMMEEMGALVDAIPDTEAKLEAGLRQARKEIQSHPDLTSAQKAQWLAELGIESDDDIKKTAKAEFSRAGDGLKAQRELAKQYVEQVFLERMLSNESAVADPYQAMLMLQALSGLEDAGSRDVLSVLLAPSNQAQLRSLPGNNGSLGDVGLLQALLAAQTAVAAPVRRAHLDPRAAVLADIVNRQQAIQEGGGPTASRASDRHQAADLDALVEIILSTTRGNEKISREGKRRLVDLIRGATPEQVAIGVGTLALAAADGDPRAKDAIEAIKEADRSAFTGAQAKAIEAALDTKLVDKEDTDDISSSGTVSSRSELTGDLKAIRDDIVGLLPSHQLGRERNLRQILGFLDGNSVEDIATIFDDLPKERKERLLQLLDKHDGALGGELKEVAGKLKEAIQGRRYTADDTQADVRNAMDTVLRLKDSAPGIWPEHVLESLDRLARLDDASLKQVVDEIGYENVSILLRLAGQIDHISEPYKDAIARIKDANDRDRTLSSDTDAQEIARRLDEKLLHMATYSVADAKVVLDELTKYSPEDLARIVHARGPIWNADGDTWENLFAKLEGQQNAEEGLGKLREALNTPTVEELGHEARKALQAQVREWVPAHKASGMAQEGALEAVHALSALSPEELEWVVTGLEPDHLRRIANRLRPEDKERYAATLTRLETVAESQNLAV